MQYKDKIINISAYWRLRPTDGNPFYTCFVNKEGSVDYYYCIDFNDGGVRYALKTVNLQAGKIKIGGWTFTNIADKVYLSDSINFYDYFDLLSYIYEGSHIKNRLQQEVLPIIQQYKIEVMKDNG